MPNLASGRSTGPEAELLAEVERLKARLAKKDEIIATVAAEMVSLLELPPADADRYEFGEVVATGGFGLVRRAFDRRLGRVVAVKELRHSDPGAAALPVRGDDHGPPAAPRHRPDPRHRPLPGRRANILIGEHGETVVIDWGLAKDLGAPGEPGFALPRVEPGLDATLTDMGAVLGTLHYMPPEQARGQAVDRRSDVFALGAVLFHVLVGQPPRAGLERSAILARLTRPGLAETAALRLSSGPRELIAIAEKAMAPRPDDRYVVSVLSSPS